MKTAIDLGTLPAKLRDNPLFHFSEETHLIPAWDRIRPEHFQPAFDYAFALTREKIEAVKNDAKKPNFTNTVEALEQSFDLLNAISLTLYNMMPRSRAEEEIYDRMGNDIGLQMTDFYNSVFTDKALFERVKQAGKSPGFRNLSAERKYLYESYINGFTDDGAGKSKGTRAELAQMNRRITELAITIQRNMKMAAREMLLIENEEDLKGLSDFARKAAAERARENGHESGWAFNLGKDSYVPFISGAENRDLRRRLWEAYHTQATHGPYDNRALILELNELQQKSSRKAGYRNHAAQVLTYEVAQEPRAVVSFLNELKKAARPVAREELKALQEYASRTDGIEKLEPWDVRYYQEKLKKDALGFDDEDLRPYFELENVLQGSFAHFEKLFGMRFEETQDYPGYHSDVRAFNVTKARTGEHLGVLFLDLFAREGKPPGTAWSMSVVPQGLFMGEVRRPVDMVVCKFTKGQEEEPTLLRHYDVLVLFHELGHAAHNLLSRYRYPSLSGTSVSHDKVEYPSQMQENWAWEPEVLKTFARHYQTGETMPDDLLEKLHESRKFMAGSRVLRMALKGRVDIAWGQSDPEKISCIEDFEKAATRGYRLMDHHGTIMSPHMSHIFGGGYESTLYSYQWTEVREARKFASFKNQGLYNRSLASEFRQQLESGNLVDWSRYGLGSFLKREGLTGRFNYEAANDNEAAPEQEKEQASKSSRATRNTPQP